MLVKEFIISLCVLLFLPTLKAQEESISVNNKTRSFHYTLPDSYNHSDTFPLVIVLHGFHNEVESIGIYTNFDKKASKENFVVVYPHGTMNKNGYYLWNAGSVYSEWTNEAKDIAFISALIEHISRNYSIDKNRIYITGHSNGAMMAYRVAAELSEKIAAVACVSGQMADMTSAPSQPVPLLHIHGDSDMVIPHQGITQYGFRIQAIDDVLKKWLEWNNCSTVPAVLKYSAKLTALKWTGDAEIRLYLLHGHGHDWPTNERGNWAATDYIWDFFKAHQNK